MLIELNILIRLVVAAVLAGVVGWEREATGKAAGIRTHILVGMGAALFVALGEIFIARYTPENPSMRFDPIRIIEAVVTGISFLGAGMIFVSRGGERVKGLTTAASILVTAGVGIAAGLERYVLAVGCTALVFLVLKGLRFLDNDAANQKREDLSVNREKAGVINFDDKHKT